MEWCQHQSMFFLEESCYCPCSGHRFNCQKHLMYWQLYYTTESELKVDKDALLKEIILNALHKIDQNEYWQQHVACDHKSITRYSAGEALILRTDYMSGIYKKNGTAYSTKLNHQTSWKTPLRVKKASWRQVNRTTDLLHFSRHHGNPVWLSLWEKRKENSILLWVNFFLSANLSFLIMRVRPVRAEAAQSHRAILSRRSHARMYSVSRLPACSLSLSFSHTHALSNTCS